MIRLDDFVMLGKTVPEPNSDGRVFVCSAGVSPQLRQLIRIYPLARSHAPSTWSVSTVMLERNPKDSRPESWALAGDRTPAAHGRINNTFAVGELKYPVSQRARLLAPFAVESIVEANERNLSLAVMQPDDLGPQCLEFEYNPESPDSPELTLFDVKPRPVVGARRFPFIPRLRFRDSAGEHRLMLREWGVYELMRKTDGFAMETDAERRRWVAGALHLDASCSLLLGNFNRYRRSWLVIAVLRGLRPEPTLLDLISAGTGESE